MISKSNRINKIPTKKNGTENCCLAVDVGSKPLSKTDVFSTSGFCIANIYEPVTIATDKTPQQRMNNNKFVFVISEGIVDKVHSLKFKNCICFVEKTKFALI